MARRHAVYSCPDCGAEVLRQTGRPGPKLCPDCAALRIAENAYALRAKDPLNPIYQRWLAGQRAAVASGKKR